MIGPFVSLVLLSWLFGRTKGLFGALIGGFLGAAVLTGMTSTAGSELTELYSPDQLLTAALSMAVVAAVLALIAPYATGFACVGWGAGALLAAVAACRMGAPLYALAFGAHILAAADAAYISKRRAAAG